MAEQQAEAPPAPAHVQDAVYLYRLDPVSNLPVVVGKAFVNDVGRGWVFLIKEDLAAGIGAEVQGLGLVTAGEFQSQEPE